MDENDTNLEKSSAEESNLDIEALDAGQFNAYGSSMAHHRPHEETPQARAEQQVGELQEQPLPERVICACKNTCSRKQSARIQGCPCRNANLNCCQQCRCGTKKAPQCKNRGEGLAAQTSGNASALEAHQQDLIASQGAIEQFVEPLSLEARGQLLVRLLGQGRGSLDYARNLLHAIENPQAPPVRDPAAAPWCKCGVCRPMPNQDENKCCQKVTCVTSYGAFHNLCVDITTLRQVIRQRADIMADPPDYSMNSFRKAAYRSFIIMKYGKLGKGNRRVIPACVVSLIRDAYPSEDNVFMGFRAT